MSVGWAESRAEGVKKKKVKFYLNLLLLTKIV